MRPEIESATKDIDARFGDRLAACEALRDFGLSITQPWGGRALDGPADALLGSLFVRSFNTNWATLELCRIGFADQAQMLQRSLFEDMVDAHWVSINPGVAAERYNQQFEHGHLLFGDAPQHRPDFFKGVPLPTFTPERPKFLNKLFGDFGQKSWTGANLHDRVRANDPIKHFEEAVLCIPCPQLE